MKTINKRTREVLLIGASLGALNALINAGKIKRYLTESQAYELYGRATVEEWVRQALISPFRSCSFFSAKKFDRMDLELLVRAQELSALR
ncbi:hypothetical protein ABDD95_12620 [Mucilaginibacter sp. PAMB04274]|uniref:hypothetical protein n=1 Tax=Mucilaginibacter sp. PAMB04274 TaxID=3138568 RepID=UPI0031F6AD1E